jgi:hypothetical protein
VFLAPVSLSAILRELELAIADYSYFLGAGQYQSTYSEIVRMCVVAPEQSRDLPKRVPVTLSSTKDCR